jgi:transposase
VGRQKPYAPRQIDAIGVDEIQYAKGHKYLTLVYQIDLGVTRLLWVGKERAIDSFRGFFAIIGDDVASRIASVLTCGTLFEGHPREVPRGSPYPRSFPYRGKNEQGSG